MPRSDQEVIAAALIVARTILKRRKKKMKRKCWTREWIQRRFELGAGDALVKELEIEDSQQFRNFVRMTAIEVQFLIDLTGPIIAKKDTVMRKAISVKDRVIVTLRFLASGT